MLGPSFFGKKMPSLHEDPSAEFISTEAAEVSRFLARPGDFTYAVTEVTAEGRVSRSGMFS